MKLPAWSIALLIAAPAMAATAPVFKKQKLVDRLADIRGEVIHLQQDLIDSVKTQKEAKSNLKKIQMLLKLQQEEREIQQKRMQELESTISELESRRGNLKEKITVQQKMMRQYLKDLSRSLGEQPKGPHLPESEKVEAPRRKTLANLVGMGVREVEALKADLQDADLLEVRIQEEKQQLAYLSQDLKEKESVLELNRQLQSDLLKRNHAERVAQLENYRQLKASESQVENLIQQFNARMELEKSAETERVVSRAMLQGEFGRKKGKLPLPVSGQVVSSFGRVFDQRSSLYVFKKGIDISAGKKLPVQAVSSGKVAFSGELPDYGKVTIIDHGDHFYTLCAHLGELSRKTGDSVKDGEPIGYSDDAGTPIYFEVRARNVAVNPLQWVSN